MFGKCQSGGDKQFFGGMFVGRAVVVVMVVIAVGGYDAGLQTYLMRSIAILIDSVDKSDLELLESLNKNNNINYGLNVTGNYTKLCLP